MGPRLRGGDDRFKFVVPAEAGIYLNLLLLLIGPGLRGGDDSSRLGDDNSKFVVPAVAGIYRTYCCF